MAKISNEREDFFYQNIDELLKIFNSDPNKGLSDSQIESKLNEFGPNELPEVKKNLWRVYLAPIFNFLILILIISGIVVVILGSPTQTMITFTVVIINSIVAIIQQFRAHKALKSLKDITALKSIIIRNGNEDELPSKELVPGDIIMLSQGSKVPADGRIIELTNLTVNEAPLTGESEPVEKTTEALEKKSLPLQKQRNMVFMGTYINTGRAKVLITKTGINTEIGEISMSLNKMGAIEEIPLTRRMNKLGRFLGLIVLINLTFLIIHKLFILHESPDSAITQSIIRAMNIMPINLPLLVTLVLITGVLNMAQNGVIIKNLSAIESLGRVSVICSDKTGTITKNEMTVEKFWINSEEFEVSGSGYESEGFISKDGKNISFDNNLTFQKFIDSMVINNHAKLVYEDVKVRIQDIKVKPIRKAIGSTTEAALLVLAEKAGFNVYDIKKKYEVLKEFSFNSILKRMTTISKLNNEDSYIAYSKGAPEILLSLCSHIKTNSGKVLINDQMKSEITEGVNKQTNQGYRTLAVAYKDINTIDDIKREDIEKDLIFLGFLSIIDPPRIGVKEAVEKCKTADIKVIMITGDHPNTAKTIATEMGIYKEGDLVVEGKEIKQLDDNNFYNTSIFARVAPADKEIIISKHQKKKKIVAMTGDGINDSLALKLANCGIAMGITGTDVAKDASDMVISDDNFTSIEKGVKIGRGLFSKIRIILYFFICLNILEGTIMFTYEFLPGFDLFSSNWQHIYIFTVAHTFPSLALVVDIPPKDIMKEPPRNEEELLNRNTLIMLIVQAVIIGLCLVLVLELTLNNIIPLNDWNTNTNLSFLDPDGNFLDQKARTMFMTTLFISETTFIWTFRRPNKSLFKSIKEDFSKNLFIMCLFTLLIHVLLINFSLSVNTAINDDLGLNLQLNYMFLSLTDWLICIGFGILGIFLIEIFKFVFRKKKIIF